MRNIVAAKNAGFCMGVKRAVDMAIDLAGKTKGRIYTYGPLIHNPHVVELLSKKGVVVLSKGKMPKKGAIIIRTHGIAPSIYKKVEGSGLKIFDATCPFVKKVQNIIKEYSNKGYKIIIVGDKGHAEVISYLGYAHGKGIVVSSKEDFKRVVHKNKLCIVAQTTQDKKMFREIVREAKRNNPDTEVFDTICNATSKRQEEALKLSHIADAVIVVGGRNSANTKRLAEICRASGTPTYFIEEPGEIKLNELLKYNTIGVTAGASTSHDTIQQVVKILKQKAKEKGPGGTPFQRSVWKEIAKIPFGETRTYKEIAKAIKKPRAFRAVGMACKNNPVPVTVPCHRVVYSDGSLGGYSGGKKLKKTLLDMEKSGSK